MKNVLNFILSFLPGYKGEEKNTIGSEVYLIETNARKYCGIIIYQDNVVIKMQCVRPRSVKILKANIERITIIRNEATQQYWQWQNEKAKTWKLTTFPASNRWNNGVA